MENVINLSDGTNCGLDHDLKKQHAMKSYGGLPAGELPATDSRRRYFTPIPGLPAIPSLSDSLMTTEQKTELMTDLVNRICEYYDVAVEHVYIYRCFGKTTDYDRQVSAAVSCVIYTFRCLGVCCRRMANMLDRNRATISTNTYRLRLKVMDDEYFRSLRGILDDLHDVVVSRLETHASEVDSLAPERVELELSGTTLLRARVNAMKQGLTMRDYVLMQLYRVLQLQ